MAIGLPELQRPKVSKSGKKTKSITVILAIVVIIIILGVATEIREAQSSYTREVPGYYTSAYCWGKVLKLAVHGEVAGAEGVNGAMYECTHVVSPYSIYSDARM
jgi:hypothetical protein